MISVSQLGMAFGAQTLFTGVSFRLRPGERYGLVGANGSGKTTLISVLAGDRDPTGGTVSVPRGVKLGVLRQDQFVHDSQKILEVAMMGDRVLWEAIAAKEALLEAPDECFDAERFSELEETVQRHDGYAAEARAAEILEGLGFPSDIHRHPLSTVSGGFKLRVLLAQALAGAPDALLLDEPTNHLDILSIRWLEKFLRAFAGPVLVISHDHRFLDNVSTHILDVDYQTILTYRGNYSHFLRAKQSERERREKDISHREREIAHHQKFVDRFRAKSSKARQAQSKLRLIEKRAEMLEELPASSRRYPTFRFDPKRPSGREVLSIEGIAKAFGRTEVLSGVDLSVTRGDRVAIMGPNGIGKSTLLKIVMGELAPDSGSVKWGYEARPGYFAQDHREQLEGQDQSAVEWISGVSPGHTVGFIRRQLGLVLFSGDEADKRLGALSGGEAARLVFCRLALERPNVLVLDEPTNHLDLESIEALIEGLQSFDGTLMFVSHDRWFVSRLATRILEITPDGIRDYAGSYEAYVHACGDDHLDVDTVVLKARREKRSARAEGKAGPGGGRKSGKSAACARIQVSRLSESRDRITARVHEVEQRIAAIDTTFCDPSSYTGASGEELRCLKAERSALQSEADKLVAEWETIEEELEGLE